MPPDSESHIPHIVCLGGGYVSLYLCKTLKRAIRRGEVRVTVIDDNNFHTFHGLIPEMLAGRIQPGHVLSSSRRIFSPARFFNARVESIDTKTKKIAASRSIDGREYTVTYDHLVVALGSVDDLARYPGIAEHTLRLKSYADCFEVRNRLIGMLELAEIEEDPEERRRLLTFVVVGGNYAGVEVGSELAEYLPLLIRKYFPRLDPDEVNLHLIVSGETVLPELHRTYPKLAKYAADFLAESKLQIHYKTRLDSATSEEAILSTGERLSTRTIISCAGTAQNPLLGSVASERDPSGRAITDEFLRVPGRENVWSGGDCAAVPHPLGGTCPGLAIYAMTAGSLMGKNILCHVRGRDPRPYRFTGLGDACTLGRRHAVAHVKGIPVKGLIAWLVWRVFMLIYLPERQRKCRVFVEWILGPFLGREVVNLRVQKPIGLIECLYEPDQVIIRQGDVGRDLFIIRSGRVEVSRERDGETEVLAELREGDHFGEAAVFENVRRTATVRALTRVVAIKVSRETALTLSSSVDSFGQHVSRRPGTATPS